MFSKLVVPVLLVKIIDVEGSSHQDFKIVRNLSGPPRTIGSNDQNGSLKD